MHEILEPLGDDALVLDIGSASGSIDTTHYRCRTIAVDRDAHPAPSFVQADAASLPFPDSSFDAVIANHSLEHIDRLDAALVEIGRVLKPSGALFISVPDAGTLCDRLYRWLARGGGHVNPFHSASALAAKISGATGLPHVATRTLCTSLSYMNRTNIRGRPPRKLWLLGGGSESVLTRWSALARWLDRRLHTRLAVYGWALYFGRVDGPVDTRTATNVCVRCGSGHPSNQLISGGSVSGGRWICPTCGAPNRFTRDELFSY